MFLCVDASKIKFCPILFPSEMTSHKFEWFSTCYVLIGWAFDYSSSTIGVRWKGGGIITHIFHAIYIFDSSFFRRHLARLVKIPVLFLYHICITNLENCSIVFISHLYYHFRGIVEYWLGIWMDMCMICVWKHGHSF